MSKKMYLEPLPSSPYFEPKYLKFDIKNITDNYFYSNILFSQLLENLRLEITKYKGTHYREYDDTKNPKLVSNLAVYTYQSFVEYYPNEEKNDPIVISINFYSYDSFSKRYIIKFLKESGDDIIFKNFYKTIYNDLYSKGIVFRPDLNGYYNITPPYLCLKSFNKEEASRIMSQKYVLALIQKIRDKKNITDTIITLKETLHNCNSFNFIRNNPELQDELLQYF